MSMMALAPPNGKTHSSPRQPIVVQMNYNCQENIAGRKETRYTGAMPPPQTPPPRRHPTSFRLSEEGLSLLDLIARQLGIKRAAVLELIIREKAVALGLRPSPLSPSRESDP
jgi:hypothetical protein